MALIEFFVTLGYSITLMYMLLDFEVNRKRHNYLIELFMAFLLACGVFVWVCLGYQSFMILYPIFVQVPLFIGFWFVSKYKGIKLLFVLLTVIALSSPPVLSGEIAAAFFGFSEVIICVVSFIMFLIITFIVYNYFRPLFLYMLRNTNKGWATFCIIPLSYNVFTYLLGKYDVGLVRDPPLLCLDAVGFILIISAYVIILRFFKQTRQQLIMQSEKEVLKTQLSAAQAHLAALKESEAKMLIYRHELHHHLNLINGYLADNKLDEAKKYITEAEKSIDNKETIKYCDNNAVNLILSSNIKRAEQENIVVESRVDITEDCYVSDMDLCIILSNAIENAINACINITDSSDRKITISCRSKIDKLFIQVTNNFIGEVKFADDVPIRTEENHGFGARSIASTVQKYNGLCSFITEDGVFKMRIIL